MEFYEFEFLSTHYHLVLFDRFGRVSDFIQDFDAVVARVLNAIRGTSGKFFDGEPGIQTVLGGEKVLEHCVYTLANAVAAGIVDKTAHWKGFNSLRMPYGKQYVINKPRIGVLPPPQTGAPQLLAPIRPFRPSGPRFRPHPPPLPPAGTPPWAFKGTSIYWLRRVHRGLCVTSRQFTAAGSECTSRCDVSRRNSML